MITLIARFTVTPDGLIVGVCLNKEALKPGHVYQIGENDILKGLGGDTLNIRSLGSSDFQASEPTSLDMLLAIAGGRHLTVDGR